MDLNDLLNELKEVFDSLSGDEITRVFNDVSERKVVYQGDSIWEWAEEDDENFEPPTGRK